MAGLSRPAVKRKRGRIDSMKTKPLFAAVFPLILALAPAPLAGAEDPGGRSSGSDPLITVRNNPKYGDILTNGKGMTLYVFPVDSRDKSKCYGGCASAWPPFLLDKGEKLTKSGNVTGAVSTFTRSDGKVQIAYNGMPLYFFVADLSPGDANGQGLVSFGGPWWVVPPQAKNFEEAKALSQK
jgi:predicted lipoprotein with Yx(FWY)xxD motif